MSAPPVPPVKVVDSVEAGSTPGELSRVIAVTANSEQQIRVALLYLRKLGQRDFRRYPPECWEEPLTSIEKQLFGKPRSTLCWCSEATAKPHTSQHYKS